jgi:hypothetical protein
MFSISRGKFAIALGLLAVMALPLTLLAHHSWSTYHWARTSNPFTVKLGDNVSSTWDSVLQTTSSDWSQSIVLNTTIVPGRSGTRRKCSATSGQVEVCNNTYGNNGWLGVANIWVSGSHITQGTVRLNDTYFNTSTYNTLAWRNLVSCQEVGHTFGLDHQDENFNNANLGTCMDYTSNPSSNQHPNQGDYDQLLCIYDPASAGRTLTTSTHSCTGTGHLDSTNTVGQTAKMPNAMVDLDFESSGQWGRLVRESRNHGQSVYELDFGGGNRIYTFVTWTLEERDRRAQAASQLNN